MIFYLIAVVMLAADQLTKVWVRNNLAIEETSSWAGIDLIHYNNTGASGSFFQGYGPWFVPVAVIVVAFVLYNRSRGKLKTVWMEIGTGLFVAGAVGNALDRLFYGGVTDFIQFKEGIVANIADVCLNVGMIVILVGMFFGRKRSGAPAKHFP